MTSQDPPNGRPRSQSPLSEAVEQGTDAVTKWHVDIADFLQQQAARLSAGDFGLNDIATAPVQMMSIVVKDTVDTAFVVLSNLALLANSTAGVAGRDRMMRVPVTVPANTSVTFVASDMVGQLGHSIPSSDLEISQESGGENPEEVHVVVKVKPSRVPNDLYTGFLSAVDNPAFQKVPFALAIDELGEPVV